MRSPAPDRALPPALHSALASAHLEARRLGSKLKSCTHDSSYKTRVIRREARGRVYVNVRLALARPLAQRRTLLGLGARGSARTRARLAPLTQARGSASAGAPRLSAMRARVLVCGSVPRRMLDAVASGRASRVLVCGSVPRRMRWHRGACACAHAVCGVRCATRPAAAPSSRAPRSLVPPALLSLGPPSSSAASHAAWARAQRRTLLGLGRSVARCLGSGAASHAAWARARRRTRLGLGRSVARCLGSGAAPPAAWARAQRRPLLGLGRSVARCLGSDPRGAAATPAASAASALLWPCLSLLLPCPAPLRPAALRCAPLCRPARLRAALLAHSAALCCWLARPSSTRPACSAVPCGAPPCPAPPCSARSPRLRSIMWAVPGPPSSARAWLVPCPPGSPCVRARPASRSPAVPKKERRARCHRPPWHDRARPLARRKSRLRRPLSSELSDSNPSELALGGALCPLSCLHSQAPLSPHCFVLVCLATQCSRRPAARLASQPAVGCCSLLATALPAASSPDARARRPTLTA